MNTKVQIVRSAILYGTVLILLTFTNPKSMPSIFLILPFVLLFVANYVTAMLILRVANGTGIAGTAKGRFIRPHAIAVLVSGFPILLLILQSIGQLTIRDLVTSLVIFVLAYFYIAKSATASISDR